MVPFGDSVTVSFRQKADLSKYGKYKIVTYGVDNNDDYLYNDTLTANLENTRITETLSVFPNPFTDKLTITINSQSADKLQISITNASGIELYETEKNIISGNNSFTIRGLNLIPSIYYLNIRGTTTNETVPILKITR